MNIYLAQLLLAAVVVYVVDVSGFTQSWRGLLARKLGIREDNLRPLPPFDCGKCATLWACLILAAVRGQLTLTTIAASAGFSLLSLPISALMLFIREWLCAIIDYLMPKR